MTEPMTDAEVKQAIERHGLRTGGGVILGIPAYYAMKASGRGFRVTVWKPTLTEAVAEVVRQIEEKQE